MVRKFSLFALLLITVLAAAVVGCKFFAASLFPTYLTQISASIDLSKEMDGFIGSAGDNFECRLYVLKNSFDQEYIFVGIHVFSPDKKKVIILDNSLKVVKELEHSDLGELHMVDVNGDFLIGNVLFDKADLTETYPGIPDANWHGFFNGTDYTVVSINDTSPDQLQNERYNSGWVWQSSMASLIETGGDFDLENASYNAARINQEVALFLDRKGDDSIQVVLIPAVWGGLATPIISRYPVFPVASDNHENYHYTNDGIVVNTHDGVAKLYGFDGKVKAEFLICDDSDAVEAYDTEGEYYYHLDVRGRRLCKCGTWW